MMNDKPRRHAALKLVLGDLITTVQVRQGKYDLDTTTEYKPAPDIVINSIEDVRGLTVAQFKGR